MERKYTDEDREKSKKSAEKLKKLTKNTKLSDPSDSGESKKEMTPEDRKKNMDRLKSNLEKVAEERRKTSDSGKSTSSYFTKAKNMFGSILSSISSPKQPQPPELFKLGLTKYTDEEQKKQGLRLPFQRISSDPTGTQLGNYPFELIPNAPLPTTRDKRDLSIILSGREDRSDDGDISKRGRGMLQTELSPRQSSNSPQGSKTHRVMHADTDFKKSDYVSSPEQSDNEYDKTVAINPIKEEDDEDEYYYDYYDEEVKSDTSKVKIVEEKKESSSSSIGVTPVMKIPTSYRVKSIKILSNPSLGPAKSIKEENKSSIATSKTSTKGAFSPVGSIKSIIESVGTNPMIISSKSSIPPVAGVKSSDKTVSWGNLFDSGKNPSIKPSSSIKSGKSVPLINSVKIPPRNPLSIKSAPLVLGVPLINSAKNPPSNPPSSSDSSLNPSSVRGSIYSGSLSIKQMTDDEFQEGVASIYENMIPSVIYEQINDPSIKSNYPKDIASSYLLAGKECVKMILRCIDSIKRDSIVDYIKTKHPKIMEYNYDQMIQQTQQLYNSEFQQLKYIYYELNLRSRDITLDLWQVNKDLQFFHIPDPQQATPQTRYASLLLYKQLKSLYTHYSFQYRRSLLLSFLDPECQVSKIVQRIDQYQELDDILINPNAVGPHSINLIRDLIFDPEDEVKGIVDGGDPEGGMSNYDLNHLNYLIFLVELYAPIISYIDDAVIQVLWAIKELVNKNKANCIAYLQQPNTKAMIEKYRFLDNNNDIPDSIRETSTRILRNMEMHTLAKMRNPKSDYYINKNNRISEEDLKVFHVYMLRQFKPLRESLLLKDYEQYNALMLSKQPASVTSYTEHFKNLIEYMSEPFIQLQYHAEVTDPSNNVIYPKFEYGISQETQKIIKSIPIDLVKVIDLKQFLNDPSNNDVYSSILTNTGQKIDFNRIVIKQDIIKKRNNKELSQLVAIMRLYDPLDYSELDQDLNMDINAYKQVYNEIDKLIPESIISNLYTLYRSPNVPTSEWFDIAQYLFQETIRYRDDQTKLPPIIQNIVTLRGKPIKAVNAIRDACHILLILMNSQIFLDSIGNPDAKYVVRSKLMFCVTKPSNHYMWYYLGIAIAIADEFSNNTRQHAKTYTTPNYIKGYEWMYK